MSVYRVDEPKGYPEGSPLHGSTYAAVYLDPHGTPGLKIGVLRRSSIGVISADAEYTSAKQDGFRSDEAAVEWMLRQMLESGQWTTNTALIALAKL